MIDNRFPGIGIIRFIPDNIHDHFISEHTAGIQIQQGKNIKFLCCQLNFLPADFNGPGLQTEMQILCIYDGQ